MRRHQARPPRWLAGRRLGIRRPNLSWRRANEWRLVEHLLNSLSRLPGLALDTCWRRASGGETGGGVELVELEASRRRQFSARWRRLLLLIDQCADAEVRVVHLEAFREPIGTDWAPMGAPEAGGARSARRRPAGRQALGARRVVRNMGAHCAHSAGGHILRLAVRAPDRRLQSVVVSRPPTATLWRLAAGGPTWGRQHGPSQCGFCPTRAARPGATKLDL